MNNVFLSSLPYLNFIGGGVVCFITSLLLAKYFNSPKEKNRRYSYAAISGIGAMAICWLVWRHFPDSFDYYDAIPLSVLIGLFGIGRILNLIAKRYGLEQSERSNEKNL